MKQIIDTCKLDIYGGGSWTLELNKENDGSYSLSDYITRDGKKGDRFSYDFYERKKDIYEVTLIKKFMGIFKLSKPQALFYLMKNGYHYHGKGGPRQFNDRINARKYTKTKPASTSTVLYIIQVGDMIKFGIADNFINRMGAYVSEFGSYNLIDTVAFDTRRLARDIEKEMIKYFKRFGKIVRGHEYTDASTEEVLRIRNLMAEKVIAWTG